MKAVIMKTLNKNVDVQELAHWSAMTYIVGLYITIISAQSYFVYLESLLG